MLFRIPPDQRKRDDNKNKICAFRGGGWAGGQGGKLSKMLFFVGNATTIKFWKWKFYCREILLSWRRLLPEAVFNFAGSKGEPAACACLHAKVGEDWQRMAKLGQSLHNLVDVSDIRGKIQYIKFEKSKRVKTQRVKTSETSRKKKCSQKIFQKISQKIEDIIFYWISKYFWISSKSSRKIAFFWEVFRSVYPLGFYP